MNTETISRATRGRFEKGKSANPAGRPKGSKNKSGLISQVLADLGDCIELKLSLDSFRDGKLVRAERLRYSIHGEQVLFRVIALRLAEMALEGNMEVIKIVLDRTEGKVPPPMAPANPLPNVRVVYFTPEKKGPSD